IFANDVKCTHGATIGQLDEEALFYLRSRGIGMNKARDLLIYAFASDVIERITVEPLREELHRILHKRLEAAHELEAE
ncbi:MAG TPA: SufD family Fe-S cluster assembly protein, partial [Bacteroidota bacterium]